MRTVAVFLGGVALSYAVPMVLGHFLQPDSSQLVVKIFTTPPNSPEWPEIWRRWHHVNLVALYVMAPLAGLVVGTFVGLLQKHHAAAVAASCLLPGFLDSFWADRAKSWATSASGILFFIAVRSLPFVTAILAATLCQRWLRTRRIAQAPAFLA